MRAVSALVCVFACGWLSTVHAQVGSAVLLPARGDDRLPTQRDEAQQALAEALTAQGYRVVSHGDALVRLPEGAPACASVDCAPSMLRALTLNLAAACAVWLSPDAPEGTVFVTLVDDAGARYPGARPVHGGELAIATRAALADARALQMLGPGPWVRIHGQPEGARVYIDNQLAGALPYRAAMTAGRYALRVEGDGRAPDEQDLDIPLNAGRVVEIEVNLLAAVELPAPAATTLTAQPAPTERRAHAGDYVLGGALAVGGIALMTVDPLHTLARDGDCADSTCQRVYGFSARSTLQVIGGAGMVALGAVITFVVKPFATRITVGEHSTVSLRTTF